MWQEPRTDWGVEGVRFEDFNRIEGNSKALMYECFDIGGSWYRPTPVGNIDVVDEGIVRVPSGCRLYMARQQLSQNANLSYQYRRPTLQVIRADNSQLLHDSTMGGSAYGQRYYSVYDPLTEIFVNTTGGDLDAVCIISMYIPNNELFTVRARFVVGP
jgi:hypothetical protein